MEKYTKDIVEYAFHGIDDSIGADETVTVNLRDLMKVRATLAELVQFFHQPMHYPTIDDVNEYIGDSKSDGAFALLCKANYNIMKEMLPERVDDLYDEGAFDAPKMP